MEDVDWERENGDLADGLRGDVGPEVELALSKIKAVSVKLRW